MQTCHSCYDNPTPLTYHVVLATLINDAIAFAVNERFPVVPLFAQINVSETILTVAALAVINAIVVPIGNDVVALAGIVIFAVAE